MNLHLKVALISFSYILGLSFLPTGCSDELNWACTCTGLSSNNDTSRSSNNCSSSCQCSQDERSGVWNCTCGSQPTANMQDLNCFTSCNCTSLTRGGSKNSSIKENLSNKGILITVILCATLTAIIAVLGSVTCYLYRKDQLPAHTNMNSRVHTSDKYSSYSSHSHLISHHSSSLSGSAVKTGFSFNPLKSLVRQVSRMIGEVRESLPGVIVRFSYGELDLATNKFSDENIIGVGGTSKVYRGQLSDGRMVAIKKLRPVGSEADFEFLSEIELISRLNHRHVVPLLGYCSENHNRQSERLLVFEYMSNGNLRDFLNKAQGMINNREGDKGVEIVEWKTRVAIALGAARGLEYLHEAAATRILHRDIKSTNILLDDMLRAKITDLGMAKQLVNDENMASCSSSPARMLGTFGYFAPEYAIVGKASLKSDVFSFGVVLLELITGRPPVHKSPNKADESLVLWATPRLRDSKLVLTELPDPLLKGNFPEEEMQIMAHLARECLQWDPESRPTMSEIVQILSTIDPDKTNRRKLPPSFFMSTPHGNKRSITGTNTPRVNSLARREMLIQASSALTSERWSNQTETQTHLQCPPSPMSSTSVSEDQNDMEFELRLATDLPPEYAERLIKLSSGSHSWRSLDDEAVDLTEPRLEAFTQPDVFRTKFT